MFDSAATSVQRSLDDLAQPLAATTFCVVDLETTGGSPAGAAITEVGAVKVRRGEVLGTFQTLVNPRTAVPPIVRHLTGIDDRMLEDAPPIETVLPSFLEFSQGAVMVAHNARFDTGFLNAALAAHGYPALQNRVVCTARLARKLLAGEVPNHRLETLSSHLRCAHSPSHRAYTDALATCDVLHHLIERATGYGVTTVDELLAVTAARLDGTFAKISLAAALPSSTGVYRFLNGSGATLYVGKATDVKARVKSYFYGDHRRKVRDLLREAQAVSVEGHATLLEAEVAEARAIASESPPYNRRGKQSATWYVRLDSRRGKLAPCRVPRDDDSLYLGPLRSIALARTIIDACRDVFPIHRCADPARCRGCAFGEMGSCVGERPKEHEAQLARLATCLLEQPRLLLTPLHHKMVRLGKLGRFEEAAALRERGRLIGRLLLRHASIRAFVDAGEVVFTNGKRTLVIHGGTLRTAADTATATGSTAAAVLAGGESAEPATAFVARDVDREAQVILGALCRNSDGWRLVAVTGQWSIGAAMGPTGNFDVRGEPP